MAETLSPIRRMLPGERADEGEAVTSTTTLGEVGVLGQEAVAGVDADWASVTSAALMISAGMLR